MIGGHDFTEFMRELAALRDDETPLYMEVTRWQLWCLMSAVQLASRHPQGRESEIIQTAMAIAREIQPMAAPSAVLAQIAEQGWHEQHDGPAH
jgi:hypothetical protein